MQLSKDKILNGFRIGYEFEFFTNKSKKEAAKEIEKACGVKVVLPTEVVGFNKIKTNVVHDDYVPTDKSWKITNDYSGGKLMMELVTGPIVYPEARIQMIKFLNWVKENGWTTKKTGIHLNMSIDNDKLTLRNQVQTMDRLKFCLDFDEDFIYKRFPKRKGNVYAKSIKQIYPINKFNFNNNVLLPNTENYTTPSTKYYGVNFIKTQKNYLEFRYLGGANYENKINDILEIAEHCCLSMYHVLLAPELSTKNIDTLNGMMNKHKKIIRSFADFNSFLMNYPKIKLMVDLKGDEQTIKSFFASTLRNKLYDLIVYCNMRSGILNYDRDLSVFQVKDAILTKCENLRDIEIINCKVDGIFYNCTFYNSTVEDSHIHDSKLMKTCIVKRSKVEKTPIFMSNELEECYIDNKSTIVSGHLTRCIIRNGDVSQLAKLIDTNKVEE